MQSINDSINVKTDKITYLTVHEQCSSDYESKSWLAVIIFMIKSTSWPKYAEHYSDNLQFLVCKKDKTINKEIVLCVEKNIFLTSLTDKHNCNKVILSLPLCLLWASLSDFSTAF